MKYVKKKFIPIHKPPASIRFAPIKYALAVTVEPFKFSPAEPVVYELRRQTNPGGGEISLAGAKLPAWGTCFDSTNPLPEAPILRPFSL